VQVRAKSTLRKRNLNTDESVVERLKREIFPLRSPPLKDSRLRLINTRVKRPHDLGLKTNLIRIAMEWMFM